MTIYPTLIWILMLAAPSTVPRRPSPVPHPPFPIPHPPSPVNRQPSTVNRRPSTVILAPFLAKLRELEQGKRDRVVILHIGDSHVQAGFLPGALRDRLQERFGAAGRGLVLPLKLAGSHNTLDVIAQSNAAWDGRLRTFQQGGPPVGLSGSSLRTASASFTLEVELKPHASLDNSFDQIRWFAEPGQAPPSVTGPGGKTYPSKENSFPAAYELESPVRKVRFTGVQTANSASKGALLYGISFEKGKTGVLYHAAGLNGATFYHYHHAEQFFRQIPALKPDLVIVTLGTNESLLRPFRKEELRGELEGFLQKTIQALPGTPLLLWTPPDTRLKSGLPNPQGAVYRDMVLQAAAKYRCAVWDLFEAMGGEGSIRQWKSKGLAHGDEVHFTQAGYDWIGKLLFNDLMEWYEGTN
ncbi:MAG: hypothetical protein IPK21_12110 [Haliscomenobacter sp.]|nr:hypothetical protein [Haliscomenobacter sp.]